MCHIRLSESWGAGRVFPACVGLAQNRLLGLETPWVLTVLWDLQVKQAPREGDGGLRPPSLRPPTPR